MCNLCQSTMNLHMRPERAVKVYYPRTHGRAKKAGVCVYSSSRRAMLLIQSCHKYWGLPKGTLERQETLPCCASRELHEEACISIPPEILAQCRRIRVSNVTLYLFDIDNPELSLYLQTTPINPLPGNLPPYDGVNDSTGFMWIEYNCLQSKLDTDPSFVASSHVGRVLSLMQTID